MSYRVHVAESTPPDGFYRRETFSNATWTYTAGDWRGSCSGETVSYEGGEESARAPIQRTFTASSPPHWPLFNTEDPGAVGSTVTSWYMQGCSILSRDARYDGLRGGDHAATDFDDGSPDDYLTTWSTETGLVETWDWSQRNTVTRGELTAVG